MIDSSWYIEHDRLRLVILGQFLPFYHLKTQKNPKFSKRKKKKMLEISFYTCAPKIIIIWCTDVEIRSETENFVILGHFLSFYTPNGSKNQNLKKWKQILKISSFFTCVPQIMITWCVIPEIWCATEGRKGGQTDGRKNRQEKWHIEVIAPPKN